MKTQSRWLGIPAFLVLAMLAGCGGGGGGGGSTPPPSGTPANAAGTWTVTETGTSNTCGDAVDPPYSITIAQSGNALTVTTPVGIFTGTINGSVVSWTGSYPEDGGTTTITSLTATVSGNTFSGSSNWTWAGPSPSCAGTTSFTGTLTSGGGGGSAPIGALAGVWQITETSRTSSTASCAAPADPLGTFIIYISQNGSTVRAQGAFDESVPFDATQGSDGSLLTGTISGNALSITGTNPDGVGTTTQTVTGTVAASCNSFTGSSAFSYSETGFSCTGITQFTAARTLGSGCAGNFSPTAVTETAAANNTAATGQVITLPAAISGTSSSGTDDDWYRFTLTANTPVTITLTSPVGQDIDVGLFDSTGAAIIGASTSTFSNEAVAATLAPGTYTVVVDPFAITGTPAYTLVIQ